MKKRALDWLIASGVVLVLGFPYLGLGVALDRFGMGSAEVAGWAQAFGTIAAIVGMFYVGRFQAEKARLNNLEMDKRNLARRHSALCAILDDAYEQCARLKATVGDQDEAFHELSFIVVFDERSFGDFRVSNMICLTKDRISSQKRTSRLLPVRILRAQQHKHCTTSPPSTALEPLLN